MNEINEIFNGARDSDPLLDSQALISTNIRRFRMKLISGQTGASRFP